MMLMLIPTAQASFNQQPGGGVPLGSGVRVVLFVWIGGGDKNNTCF